MPDANFWPIGGESQSSQLGGSQRQLKCLHDPICGIANQPRGGYPALVTACNSNMSAFTYTQQPLYNGVFTLPHRPPTHFPHDTALHPYREPKSNTQSLPHPRRGSHRNIILQILQVRIQIHPRTTEVSHLPVSSHILSTYAQACSPSIPLCQTLLAYQCVKHEN
jgi:hypothetical protein